MQLVIEGMKAASHWITRIEEFYDLPEGSILNRSRKQPIAEARQVAMTFVREKTGMSYLNLGRVFDRDHTTVIYALRKNLDVSWIEERL